MARVLRSLAIAGSAPTGIDPERNMEGLVVGYVAPPEHAYRQTLDVLADVLD